MLLFSSFLSNYFISQIIDLPPNRSFLNIKEVDNNLSILLNIDNLYCKTIKNDDNYYSKLDISGYFHHRKIGYPELAQVNQLIEIPNNGKITIKIVSKKSKTIDLDSLNIPLIFPAQRSISKSEDPENVIFEKNSKVYNSNKFFKPNLVNIEKTGILRKHQLARLEICPFEYNPLKNVLVVYYELQIDVEFTNGNFSENVNKIYDNIETRSLINNSFKNRSNSRDTITSYPTSYVIISDRSFEQQIQPLINWKTKKGFKVIESYTDQPEVGNTSESIKSYLSDLYNNPSDFNPPSYILLVGDVDEIPSFSGLHGNHVTDLYYAEYDGNGDIYADAYYGRFSSSSPTEIQNMVDKTIAYEKYNFEDPSFLGHSVMISGVDNAMAPTHGNGQINYANQYYTNSSNNIISHTYLFPESGNSSSDILQKINNGCAFVNYTAHGYEQGWVDPAFSCTDVHSMTNFGKPALMIGNCCQSNKFDDPESFGEALLRVDSSRGAIGYIGGSNDTYWNEDYWWAVGAGIVDSFPEYVPENLGFYDRLFHLNGESQQDWYVTNSQIMMAGNLAVSQAEGADAYYCEIYHLMGDPSLMTFLWQPDSLTVQHVDSVVIGINTINIICEKGAYVSLTQNGVFIDAGLVSEYGTINLDISNINSLDLIEVVVTKQNKIPFFSIIEVLAPEGIFLQSINNEFNDESGNNNNEVDFNEIINLNTTIKNFGDTIANEVYAILSSFSSSIEILQDSAYFGTISAGDSILSNNFRFQVGSNVEDQQLIPFIMEIYDNQSNVWNSYIQTKVNAPNSYSDSYFILDSLHGNNNSRIEPGEILQIKFPVYNDGHADHNQLIANLTSNSDLVEISPNIVNIGDLQADDQSEILFDISVDSSLIPGNKVTFNLFLIDGGFQYNYEFEIIVGLVIESFSYGEISTAGWINNSFFPWVTDSINYYSENYSFMSSNSEADDTQSVLELNLLVELPSDLSFMKKVSSEENYDKLRFFIDNVEHDSWSGEHGWSYHEYQIDTGYHNFKWIYEKDFSVLGGLDAAWIDDIVFPVSQASLLSVPRKDKPDILIYPNPTSSKFYLSSQNTSFIKINLLDIYGRIVENFDNIELNRNIFTIDVNNLKKGFYFIQVSTPKDNFTKRVIVN